MIQSRLLGLLALIGVAAFSLAGCEDSTLSSVGKATRPIPASTLALMSSKGVDEKSPMLIRTYKKEAEF